MRLHLTKRTAHNIPFGLIYGTIAVLGLVAARFLPVQKMLPSCVFKTFTGIPCPTCGTTLLLTHLAHGDLTGAVCLNPAVACVIIAALLLLVYDAATLFSGSRVAWSFSHRESSWIRSGAVAAFLMNWFYLAINL